MTLSLGRNNVAELAKGLALFLFFSSMWAGLVAAFLSMCDLVTMGFIKASGVGSDDVFKSISETARLITWGWERDAEGNPTSHGILETLFDIFDDLPGPDDFVRGIMSFFLVIAGFTLNLYMGFRYGFLIILVAAGPLMASAYLTGFGKEWAGRLVQWVLAWGVFKPVAALLLVTAVTLSSSSDLQDASGKPLSAAMAGMIGFAMLMSASMSLPALVKLLVPAAGAVGSQMPVKPGAILGGGLAVVAGGAQVALGAKRASGGSSGSGGSGSGGKSGKAGADSSASSGRGGGSGGSDSGSGSAGESGASGSRDAGTRAGLKEHQSETARPQDHAGGSQGGSSASVGASAAGAAGSFAGAGVNLAAGNVAGGLIQGAQGVAQAGQAVSEGVNGATAEGSSDETGPSGAQSA
ncbi:hypothetical protein H8R18_00755 [Nanchangia anserum]|nr:hypothetical protein [Nanchangia anserum]QOX81945.1 hypothetical protein H8R18_00755 [Nanchangia anserum]